MGTIQPLTFPEQVLTERQLEVFSLLGKGKNADEIAELLFITKKTVWSHRRVIMERLGLTGAKGAYDLLVYAIKLNITINNYNPAK